MIFAPPGLSAAGAPYVQRASSICHRCDETGLRHWPTTRSVDGLLKISSEALGGRILHHLDHVRSLYRRREAF